MERLPNNAAISSPPAVPASQELAASTTPNSRIAAPPPMRAALEAQHEEMTLELVAR